MFLIIGLGNIGAEFEKTRHNIGFMIVDKLIEKYKIANSNNKFDAILFTKDINGEKVIFAKPTTYMNNSGIAVSKIKNFYKIPLENIIVFQDDMDLELCKIKIKVGGEDAGHNGIKSINSNIGKEYTRIRFGIGRPEFKYDVVNFVLGKFSENDLKDINFTIEKISNNFEELLKKDKLKFIEKTRN